MKKKILIIVAGLLLISLNVFADDVSIDSNGNVRTGVPSSGNLEVTGASAEKAIAGQASGTGGAGVYGINTTSGNYGYLGWDTYGVFGYNPTGWAGYFDGNARVTGDLTVDGTLNVTENDPQVGTLVNGKWCTSDGAQVNCSQNPPLLTETDPTVNALGKAALSCSGGQVAKWNGLLGIWYCADETDPQVGTNTANYVPKWNGSALATGTIFDNGNIGIGTATPNEQLEITGNLRLPATTGTTGIIKSGTNTLIHTYGPIGSNNFFAGANAGNLTMTGYNNNASGAYALFSNTNGYENTASGATALYYNTTGFRNTANGVSALYANTTGDDNTASGHSALASNTIGNSNTASGYTALYSNTTANSNTAVGGSALFSQSYANGGITWNSDNTAVGYRTLYANQPTSWANGIKNTALGSLALSSNTTGYNNTASGSDALFSNTTGAANTASGVAALYTNTTGANNTANGASALTSNTTGNYNTASGVSALYANTTGNSNTAIGVSALRYNTTANMNTAVGRSALYTQSYDNSGTAWDSHNTAVGFEALLNNQPTGITNGNYNTAQGSQALYSNTTGYYNTASGASALYSNTTGVYNTAYGRSALYSNTTGANNTAYGRNALYTNTDGDNNTAIGTSAGVLSSGLNNATAIGYNASVNASDKVRIGNTAVTVIEGQVAWSYPSDIRIKKDIEGIGYGLEFVSQLRPVQYRLKEGNDRIDFGFIAQDIEMLLGTEYNILSIGEDAERQLSLRYTDLIAPMVKAIQEQQEMIDSQQVKIESQQEQLDELKKIVEELKRRI